MVVVPGRGRRSVRRFVLESRCCFYCDTSVTSHHTAGPIKGVRRGHGQSPHGLAQVIPPGGLLELGSQRLGRGPIRI